MRKRKYTPSSPAAPTSNIADPPVLQSLRRISSIPSEISNTEPAAEAAVEPAAAAAAEPAAEAEAAIALAVEEVIEALIDKVVEAVAEAALDVNANEVALEAAQAAVAEDPVEESVEESEEAAESGYLAQWWDLTSQGMWLDFKTKQLPALPFDVLDAGLTLVAAPIALPLKVLDAAIAGTRSAAAGWHFGKAATDKYSPDMDWRKKQALKIAAASTAFTSGVVMTMFNPKLKLFSQFKTQYNATVPLYTTGKIDTMKVASATKGTIATETGLSVVTGYVKGELKELVKAAMKNAITEPTYYLDTLVNWAAATVFDSAASAISIGGKLGASQIGVGGYTLKKADVIDPEAVVEVPGMAATLRELGRNQLKAITSSGFTAAAGSIAGMAEDGAAYGTRAASALVTAFGETAKTTTSAVGDKNFDPMVTVGNEITPGRHGGFNLADVEQGHGPVDLAVGTYRSKDPDPQLAPSTHQQPVAGTSRASGSEPDGRPVPQAGRGMLNLAHAVNKHHDRQMQFREHAPTRGSELRRPVKVKGKTSKYAQLETAL